ncbi:MAG: DUF2207 family protein [Anaerolineae bacterium]
MRKTLLFSIALLLLAAVFASGSVQAQDKSLLWKRYDVNLAVQLNSDILVEEIQEIQFLSGTFRFGFAAIPLDRVEQITDVSVAEIVNGQERHYKPHSSAPYGFVTSTNANNLEITWYFPETQGTTHTYILRYRVIGGLRFYPEGDQLWWKAIPPDHNFPIRASTITVSLPQTFSHEQLKVASYGPAATVRVNERGQVIFEAENIPADRELEVRVQFPHGVVQGSPPSWQATFDRRQTLGPVFSLVFGVLGVIILIGGPVLLYLLWYLRGRDQPVGLVAEQISELPSDLPAAVVGTLVDERADLKDVIAGILDLARRGALRMEEQKVEGFLGIGSGRDFVFYLQDASKAIYPYEKSLLRALFGGRDEVKLSDLRHKFYTSLPTLQRELYQEVVQRGFFPADPQSIRRRWMILGALGLVVAVLGACALEGLFGEYTGWAFCPAASLGVTALGVIILGNFMPRRTAKGAEETAKWLAFKRYLQYLEKQSDLEAAKDRFEEFLPYATAFGIERRLIDRFATVEAPAPSWWGPVFVPTGGPVYRGTLATGSAQAAGPSGGPPGSLAGEGGSVPSLSDVSRGMGASLSSMSAGLGALLSSASTVLASTPPSSSGGGGGRGWSGGGGFGGGGGGGGSRGFG